jgi:L-ascorbate metabolism protein UlaG (beta-lactamase superfamily)
MRSRRPIAALLCTFLSAALFSSTPARAADAPDVEMTWMSIANWYFKIGDMRIVLDGYITRVPGPPFFYAPKSHPGDQYAYTKAAAPVDVAAVTKVRDALLGGAKLDYLLSGHSHFDHSWDTPAWSRLTGAPIIGGQSTCYQAAAQGVAAAQCRAVSGGEKIDLGHGVTVRVVRFNHSGDTTNPIQHFARELYDPPVPDASGGLRAGVGEDYPNGGGGRAYLFTVDRPGRKLSFFVQTSASAFDLDKDIYVDGVSYGAPLANLAAAMADAGLKSVDAWIATGGEPVAKLIVPVIHPKVYIPSHWDGLFFPFWPGMPYPFKDDALKTYLDAQKVALMPQKQYFDTYRLNAGGVSMQPNSEVKKKLGFADVQKFDKTTLEAVSRVASTSSGDDCGEGFTGGQAPLPTYVDAWRVLDIRVALQRAEIAASSTR